MSILDMKKSRLGFFALIASLALAATPVWAKSSSRTNVEPKTQVVSESPPPAAPMPLDPSLAMANSGVDGLAGFGPSSGTVVGNRATALKEEVVRLRSNVNLNSNEFSILRNSGAAGAVQYHSTVAAITARLQNGTTKGNPILLRQWEEADISLNEVSSSLNKLNSLMVAIDGDASVASYLLDSIQAAYNLSGAIDEDHDQLKMLHDEVSRMVVQLDYLRTQTTTDIQRQTNYLASERSNVQALALAISRGEMLGSSLANRPVIVNRPTMMTQSPQPPTPVMGGTVAPSPQAAPLAPVMQSPSGSFEGQTETLSESAPSPGHLLVLIRFNQPNVEYEQQLAQAVGTAIERYPNAEFSVVSVTPSSGDPAQLAGEMQIAKRDAEGVKRSLVQLGLSPTRITMASTQTPSAQSPEVHVYIR